MSLQLRPARVRVPCSTSNLGSGFDTIGLALDRYLEVAFDPEGSDEGLVLRREGTLAGLPEDDGDDLVASKFREGLAARGVEPRGILHLTSTIPIGRGLGSSATAILAGFDLARSACGEARADEEAFEAALAHEGHGDNAAPSLYGGLRAVAGAGRDRTVIRLHLSESVGFAYAAPAARLSTGAARTALPKQVEHRVAVDTVGRLAALIRGLAEGRGDLIRIGFQDELHVPYRLPMIPRAEAAMAAASDAGAWAVTISGAGSGLIAVGDLERTDEIAEAMRVVFADGSDDPECAGFSVRPDFQGLQRLTP